MTAELAEARAQLEDARREKAELDGLIAGLEAQVVDEESAEAERRLAEQYSLERLARVRQEAARKRVERAEVAELRERREAAVRAAAEELESLGLERLAEACEEALRAIGRVCELGDARQAAVVRHAKAFLELGMLDRVHHHAGSWVVFEADGVRYDTQNEHLDGRALLTVVEGERHRRTLIPGRRAKGFTGPEPDRHPVAQLLAKRLDAAQAAGGAE
ncbi:hypothetical protein ACIPJM_02945 [Streptomyces halstedii]|uniref:hypothetical protein n=1 Tax=Streptomyces halstedii TaxID=1944 RepID=UPI00380CA719